MHQNETHNVKLKISNMDKKNQYTQRTKSHIATALKYGEKQ